MANHHYKLLVVDIDGTLISKYGNISDEDREALAKARNSGIPISFCTGRPLKSCLDIIKQLSLDGYHIFFDGALVSSPDPEDEIYTRPISKSLVKQMVDFAHSHDIDLELFSTTHYFVERETWSTRAHQQFFGMRHTIVDFDGLWGRERIIKGELVPVTPQEEAKAESFHHQFGESLGFSRARTPTYPDVTFINILAPGVSKGRALESLASHLGISLSDVMAIGDGTNDISLLSSAGLAIAMGNARDELKKVADHVTLDVEQSGLAAAVKRFLV